MTEIVMNPRVVQSVDKDLQGMPVKIVVGCNEECFYVHSSVLGEHSEFSKAALKKEWTEGQQRIINLPEDDSTDFKAYVQWLYIDKMSINIEQLKSGTEFKRLARLYGLGEKVIDAVFQDTIINAFIAATRAEQEDGVYRFPGASPISILYKNTPRSSPGRRLMVDFYVGCGHAEWLKEEVESPDDFEPEFLMDLSIAMFDSSEDEGKKQTLQEKLEEDHVLCEYHMHDNDKPCAGKQS